MTKNSIKSYKSDVVKLKWEGPGSWAKKAWVLLPGEQVCSSRQYARCSMGNGKLFMVLCYSRKLESAIIGKIALPSEMKHVKSQLILLGEQRHWQTNLGGFENQIGSFMTGLTMLTNPTRSPDDQSLWPQTKIPIGALNVEFC